MPPTPTGTRHRPRAGRWWLPPPARLFYTSDPADDAPAFFGTVYIDSSGKRWQELNLQILSQHPAFLSISA